MNRRSALLAALILSFSACAQPAPARLASEGGVEISVAPLTLPGVVDVTYRLGVRAGGAAGELVWRRELSSTRFGDGAGSLSFVGPCDAAANPNQVELEIVSIETSAGALTAGVDFVNPAPLGVPLVRVVSCDEGSDVAVAFDLIVARRADQGFFDIAVTFDDVFCSAKLDCSSGLDLLFDPYSHQRARTVVLGLACTAGLGQSDTHLYLDDLALTCDNTVGNTTVSVGGGPGNLNPTYGPPPDTTHLLYQAAVYRGREDFPSLTKLYWNVALGINEVALPTLGACHLTTTATAASTALAGGATPVDATWPVIRWDANLTDAAGAITCGEHGLDEGDEVRTGYTAAASEAFDWSIAFATCSQVSCDAAAHSAAASCASQSCPIGSSCDASGDCVAECGYAGGASEFTNAVIDDGRHTFDLAPVLEMKTTATGDGEVHGPYGSEQPQVERTLTGLPAHEFVRLRFRYWALDSWDSGEQAQAYVDGSLAWSATRASAVDCSGGWSEYAGVIPNPWDGDRDSDKCYQDVDVVVPHTASSLTLRVGSTLDQDLNDESWALGRLRVDTMSEQVIESAPLGTDAVWSPEAETDTFNSSGGEDFFGRFGSSSPSIQASLSGLPAHSQVFARLRYWSLDSWDGAGEYGYVSLDGVQAWSLSRPNYDSCTGDWTLFGGAFPNPWSDDNQKCYFDVSVSAPHTASALTVEIGSTINQDLSDESWAVSQIALGVVVPGSAALDETGGIDASAWWTGDEADRHTVTGDGLVHGPWGGTELDDFSLDFSQLPPHEAVEIAFRYWAIDSWDDEEASLSVDGRAVWSHRHAHASDCGTLTSFAGSFPNPWSGDRAEDRCYIDAVVTVPHEAESLRVTFGAGLDSDLIDESWAVGRVKITLLDGEVIYDNASDFDVSRWIPTSQVGAPVVSTTTGDGEVYGRFAGGANAGAMDAISSVFSALPSHSELLVAFRYWAIDSWDSETASASVDGSLEWSKVKVGPWVCGDWAPYTGDFPNPASGDSSQHKCFTDVALRLSHSASSLGLSFASTINQELDDESWAVGRLHLCTITPTSQLCEGSCHPSCATCSGPADDLCTSCSGGAILVDGACHCASGQVDADLGPAVSCVACDPACTQGCYGVSASECLYPN